MVFARREPLSLGRRLGRWLWPPGGFARAGRYLGHRLQRLPASPHAIAAGFASGAAASFTPFLGLHFLLALGIAWALRGNLVAALFGTAVGNPWTFPFILPGIHGLGVWMLGGTAGATPLDAAGLIDHLRELLVPMSVGCIIPALLAWIVFYLPIRRFVARLQERRRERREARRAVPAATESRITSHPASPS